MRNGVTARSIVGVLLASTCLLAVSCEREQVKAKANREVVPMGKGVIRGQAKIVGWNQPVKMLDANMNGRKMKVPDESVVVNANGTLRNVVVYVADAPACRGDISKPVVLDQEGCRYVPHVVALQAGQTLRVKNSDPAPHNVNVISKANPAENLPMPDPGYRDLVYHVPEIMHTKCDIHPWMSAYIAVFDHPFFAVTGDDGSFEISGLPAGRYKLVAWHEWFPQLAQELTVSDDRPAEASFTFSRGK